MDFRYYMPTIVRFGSGSMNELDLLVRGFDAEKILLCLGGDSMRKSGVLDRMLEMLAGHEVVLFEEVEPEPSSATVDKCVLKAEGCGLIVGLGGGSVLDTAKAVAMIKVNGGKCEEYQNGRRVEAKGLHFIAVPTTAGTGSEVTGTCVFTDSSGLKRSFRSDLMYPDVALIDPNLTLTMPPAVTASSGIDALTHAIESAVSTKKSLVTESFALNATKLIYYNLQQAFENGTDASAREKVMLGATLAGMAFGNSGVGLIHALANPMGGRFHKPHGVICALLLPHVMEFNMASARDDYLLISKILGLEDVDDLVSGVRKMNSKLKMPSRLGEIGAGEEDLEWLAENVSGSIKTNPVVPAKKELVKFLSSIL